MSREVRNMVALGAILALAALSGAYALGLHTSGSGQLARVEQRLDQLERGHRALQDTFLDGSQERRKALASTLGYRSLPAVPTGYGSTEHAQATGGAPPSPEDARQESLQTYKQMQDVLANEPLNAAWAGNVELNVRDILRGLSAQGVPVPDDARITCRSHSCMVSLDLGDSPQPDRWIEHFLTEVADDLPQARMVQVPSTDGTTTTLHILAGTRKTPPAG
jgi:hypothetical protein